MILWPQLKVSYSALQSFKGLTQDIKTNTYPCTVFLILLRLIHIATLSWLWDSSFIISWIRVLTKEMPSRCQPNVQAGWSQFQMTKQKNCVFLENRRKPSIWTFYYIFGESIICWDQWVLEDHPLPSDWMTPHLHISWYCCSLFKFCSLLKKKLVTFTFTKAQLWIIVLKAQDQTCKIYMHRLHIHTQIAFILALIQHCKSPAYVYRRNNFQLEKNDSKLAYALISDWTKCYSLIMFS